MGNPITLAKFHCIDPIEPLYLNPGIIVSLVPGSTAICGCGIGLKTGGLLLVSETPDQVLEILGDAAQILTGPGAKT